MAPGGMTARGFFHAARRESRFSVKACCKVQPRVVYYNQQEGKRRAGPQSEKGSEMFDYREIEQQVNDYIPEEYMEDYDLDAMMDFIRSIEPDVQDISEIDIDEILQCFDKRGESDPEFDPEGMYGQYLNWNPEVGDWCVWTDDPATVDIPLGIGEVDRMQAVLAALRWFAN